MENGVSKNDIHHAYDEKFDDDQQTSLLLPVHEFPPVVVVDQKSMAGDDAEFHDEKVESDVKDPDNVEVFGDEGEIAFVNKHGLALDSEHPSVEPDPEASMKHMEVATITKDSNGNSSEPRLRFSALEPHGFLCLVATFEADLEIPHKKKGLQGLTDLQKHALGLFLIFLHCVTVVAAAQTAKLTYAKDFSAPFFLVYFRSAWRIIVFPVFMVLKYLLRLARRKGDEPVPFYKTFLQCETVFGPHGLTPKTFVYPGGVLAILWITVQFAHVFAVKFLNNSIVQALFCSETAICYLLSILVLKIHVFAVKVLAVLVALGGVAFVAYSQTGIVDANGNATDLRWEGIVICLIGAFLGSVYMVAFKKLIGKSEDVGKALLITSVMAVFITIIAWPIVIIMQVTGVEYWDWDTIPWGTICISSGLTLISISLFNLCLTLTSPFLMTLSKLLGIPANYLVDWLWWTHVFDIYQIIGCFFIGLGFVLIALPEKWIACGRINKYREERRKRAQKST